ncbi:MAG: hypothetical protein O3C61_06415 [Proteobacteria bacterium]|nr:hypothetical protein [Pseudomonadota bacterium]
MTKYDLKNKLRLQLSDDMREFASEFKNWKFGIESSFGKLEEDVTTFLDNTIQSKFITEEYDNNQWFDGEMTFKEKN